MGGLGPPIDKKLLTALANKMASAKSTAQAMSASYSRSSSYSSSWSSSSSSSWSSSSSYASASSFANSAMSSSSSMFSKNDKWKLYNTEKFKSDWKKKFETVPITALTNPLFEDLQLHWMEIGTLESNSMRDKVSKVDKMSNKMPMDNLIFLKIVGEDFTNERALKLTMIGAENSGYDLCSNIPIRTGTINLMNAACALHDMKSINYLAKVGKCDINDPLVLTTGNKPRKFNCLDLVFAKD